MGDKSWEDAQVRPVLALKCRFSISLHFTAICGKKFVAFQA